MINGKIIGQSFLIVLLMTITNINSTKGADVKMKGTREGYIKVTGGKVWYKIVGANQKGTPLLLLHGGPGCPHDYLEPLEALADERPVIFYDQLGCGFSDKPSDTTLWQIERFVEELHTVRKALKLKKVHILGQSWGTMLAVEYFLTEPDGVQSMMMNGPYLSTARFVADCRAYVENLPDEHRRAILKGETEKVYDSPEYQTALMYFYHQHVCRMDPWPDCFNRSFEKFGFGVYQYMWGPSEFTQTGTLRGRDLVGVLKNISVPVLFTCGRYDEATPATTEYYHTNLPGSEMVVFENASHAHHLEKTDQFLEIIRAFLTRSER
ncbi:MAG: proline iminopeptidase-family hydrolase [Candidatus Neomarinimicrobiota bacterium]